jgi:hypothetical protein
VSGFNINDYVQVNERIEKFYAKYPDGSLQSEVLELSETRVVMRAYAYRNPDDPRPGIGHSMLTIPGKTPYTKDSEVENAETSAVGRAIAMLGFEVKKSIASRNEIESKGGQREEPRDGSLIGTARIGDRATSDGQLRQTPTGHRLGFRLEPREGDRGGILVEASDALAVELAEQRDRWFNQPVTCWGLIEQREFVPKGRTKPVVYQALVLSRMQIPTGMIPAAEGAPDEAPEAQAADAADGSGTTLTTTDPAPTAKDAPSDESQPSPVATEAAVPSSAESAAVPPDSDQCDSASPYGDNERCELLAGHKGPHKVLSLAFPETWTERLNRPTDG